jgi:dihydrolipoamide dehydrogenase
MPENSFDLTVIGSGPGGYVAAMRAAQLGMRVTCVEKDKLGGICLNWGCIPTKALLRNAELYSLIKRGLEFGFKYDNLSFDLSKIVQRSRDSANRRSKGVEYLFKKNNITKISGLGKITGKGSVEVLTEGKPPLRVDSKSIIIAAGARSRSLPNVRTDRKQVITSNEAMIPEKLPDSMIIIGAGAIGVEFAYFYNVFGTKVTLIEMMPHILPIEDSEISGLLEKSFAKKGITVLAETKVDSVLTGATGVQVKVSGKNGTRVIESEIALVAVGVQGNVEGLGLEELGVAVEKSFIKVDKRFKTNVDGIYAIGDVIGPPWLAHVASAEGIACVEGIAGISNDGVNYNNIPGCTYCQPQVASIGLTESKAKELGYDLKIGRFPFTANGKAGAIGETDGLVKIIFDAKYGELLGAHLIGPDVTELIAEICVAKSLEATAEELIKTVHAHPTLSEAVMEAAADAYQKAINI